jgi:hypothetical protein
VAVVANTTQAESECKDLMEELNQALQPRAQVVVAVYRQLELIHQVRQVERAAWDLT